MIPKKKAPYWNREMRRHPKRFLHQQALAQGFGASVLLQRLLISIGLWPDNASYVAPKPAVVAPPATGFVAKAKGFFRRMIGR